MTISTAVPSAVQIEPLLVHEASAPARVATLAPALRIAYGSDISIALGADRPAVIANFVSTLDGIVSYHTPEQAGGGEISGFFEPDLFVMGLLRAVSDAVMIGAGTLRAARHHMWSYRYPHPAIADQLANLRADLDLAREPTTVVVSGSGGIDLAQKGLADQTIPVTIITTERGRSRLGAGSPLPAHVEAVTAGKEIVDPEALFDVLRDRGWQVVLCEGGPHLLGDLLRARAVDELFLTIAPQIAGRSDDTPRLSLVERTAFTVADAPWWRLIDLRRSGNHLFTRYSFRETQE